MSKRKLDDSLANQHNLPFVPSRGDGRRFLRRHTEELSRTGKNVSILTRQILRVGHGARVAPLPHQVLDFNDRIRTSSVSASYNSANTASRSDLSLNPIASSVNSSSLRRSARHTSSKTETTGRRKSALSAASSFFFIAAGNRRGSGIIICSATATSMSAIA